jgi:hypothetical protein
MHSPKVEQAAVLLTGDGHLGAFATSNKIDVHEVLWVVDGIHRGHLTTAKALYAALSVLADDPTVRLPKRELAAALERFGALL